MSAIFKDYYKILGISQSSSSEEIRTAYRSMSMKWHPDINQNKDATCIMQDINEAYAILKDENKRQRYDVEYTLFVESRYNPAFRNTNETATKTEGSTKTSTWSYDYNVHDENLKEDINNARKYAKDIVDKFINSFKDSSKKAAMGAWGNVKLLIYISLIIMLIGLIAGLCSSINNAKKVKSVKESIIGSSPSSFDYLHSYTPPDNWILHSFFDGAFSIYVPQIVELREKSDSYTQKLNSLGFYNGGIFVFQQKGLSVGKPEAISRYARIMISYEKGMDDEYIRAFDTFEINHEIEAELRKIVDANIDPNHILGYTLIGNPLYGWISINGINALEISYRRTATNNFTTSCKIYLLYNYNEMAQIILSYHEQEANLWMPDFGNIIKTFKWNAIY